MTLLEITPVADGAHATLRIQGGPAITASIQRYRRYGQLQGTTENYQEVNAQGLLVNAPAGLLAAVMSIFRYTVEGDPHRRS